MRWDNLYIAGLGAYLPEKIETAEEAIADGRYTEAAHNMNGYKAVRVAADHETGPIIAAIAGNQAIERSGHSKDEFGLLLHTYIGHQGLDLWTPASYIQSKTIGGSAPAFEVKQGCNGALAAFEVAASYVAARPDVTAALVTSGDVFRMPYVNRWTSDDQTVEGDGAGAIVLSSRGGFAKVRATYSFGDSSLEPMGRGGSEDWTNAPFHDGQPAYMGVRKRDFLMDEDDGYEGVIAKISGNAQHTMEQALKEADTDLASLKFFVHQHIAESIATFAIHNLFGVDRAKTTFDWGQHLGMVGTADLWLGLNEIVLRRNPQPGDLALMMGVGAGYVWSVAIVEFLETPQWTE